ncbi:MAG: formylglycine-generating enzyme family protein [Alphaproteobacteria bacterium]|nr:formylglycine-generating enzyme family protein [Alphaproteobacteria bacterium]
MAMRTLILVAVAVAFLGVTLYVTLDARDTVAEILACPLQVEERAQHPGMVWIPGGTFEMGGDVYPEEGPRRTVSVDGFWMDRTEVTNADFATFVKETNYVTVAERASNPGAAVFVMPSGDADLSTAAAWWSYVKGANWKHPGGPDTSIETRDHFPVTALAYEDVAAYAKWKGRALPTEAQWEWAARAGAPYTDDHPQSKDANTWQGVFPLINTSEDGFAGGAPVGCFKPNAYGLNDMIGNVWEWTADIYAGHAPAAHVIKGGSYLCAANYCLRYRPEARQPQEADLGTSHLGFRTVLNAPAQKSPVQ